MNRKPVIICASTELLDGDMKRLFVNKAYTNAIQEAGGTLIMLPGTPDPDTIAGIVEMADGLLLTGGGDINPKWYGQELREYTKQPDDQRDSVEFALLKEAMRRELPILAICRGMQIVNVAQGGALYQDIEKEMNGAARHCCRENGKPKSTIDHEVTLTADIQLQKILGVDHIGVNSLHHQGVSEIGKGLVVAATAPDGLVEAIELEGYPFLVGVQWHPEELTDPVWKKLFSDFVSEAAKRSISLKK